MSEWKPIETVPCNQTVLVWSKSYKDFMIASFFSDGHCWFSPGLGHMPLEHALTPTHWMPLPEPPEGEQE